MKTTHTLLTLLLMALAAPFAFAGEEPGVHRQIKIAVAAGDESVMIEAEDLEVGDSRQVFTDSGKEVLLTRTEEGYDLEIDGEKIDIGMGPEGHHALRVGEKSRVFIHRGDHHAGEDGEHVFIHHGEEGYHWVQQGGEGHDCDMEILHHRQPSALEHLRATGVLDELDEVARQKIVEALEELEPGSVQVRKMIVIDVDEEVHEEVDEDSGSDG